MTPRVTGPDPAGALTPEARADLIAKYNRDAEEALAGYRQWCAAVMRQHGPGEAAA